MLSGLFKSRQSIDVGGPIGSMADAKSDAPMANPDYTAAYLAKRLSKNADTIGPQLDKELDRYRPGDFKNGTEELDFDQAEKTAFLLNSVKDYEAEAEECLKKEFKDWLSGRHRDNADPQPYDNAAGGMKRRDMRGIPLAEWYPTWWGTKQLTHLPGVREYLREDYSSQDKHSFDMNMLAQFGPSNLEEAWAYFKYWVKRRPVGPWRCLTGTRYDEPFERSGPFSMAPAQMNNKTGTMPEITRREGENPSLVDKALKKANIEALANKRACSGLNCCPKSANRFASAASTRASNSFSFCAASRASCCCWACCWAKSRASSSSLACCAVKPRPRLVYKDSVTITVGNYE